MPDSTLNLHNTASSLCWTRNNAIFGITLWLNACSSTLAGSHSFQLFYGIHSRMGLQARFISRSKWSPAQVDDAILAGIRRREHSGQVSGTG